MAMHRLLQEAIYTPSMIDHEQSIENKVKLTTSANKKKMAKQIQMRRVVHYPYHQGPLLPLFLED